MKTCAYILRLVAYANKDLHTHINTCAYLLRVLGPHTIALCHSFLWVHIWDTPTHTHTYTRTYTQQSQWLCLGGLTHGLKCLRDGWGIPYPPQRRLRACASKSCAICWYVFCDTLKRETTVWCLSIKMAYIVPEYKLLDQACFFDLLQKICVKQRCIRPQIPSLKYVVFHYILN